MSKTIKKFIFITVPNEKGIVFFFKYIIKKLSADIAKYSPSEFINATLGRTNKVIIREHKGFDYNLLINDISQHFDVCEVSGLPLVFFPTYLNFSIGIIGKRKK